LVGVRKIKLGPDFLFHHAN